MLAATTPSSPISHHALIFNPETVGGGKHIFLNSFWNSLYKVGRTDRLQVGVTLMSGIVTR